MQISTRSLATLLAAAAITACSYAAPFAEWLETTSPSGVKIRVWAEGDEFSAVFEAEDGHAAVYDETRRCYVYATKDESTGALLPSRIAVGDETASDLTALAAIPPHLRDTSEAAAAERLRRIEKDEEENGTYARWEELKAAAAARRETAATGKRPLLKAPPKAPTTGTIVGLTLLIDFPVTNAAGETTGTLWNSSHPGVTSANLADLVNGEDCTLYNNASSVRKYFEDVSCGNLSYTNIVLGPFTAPYPREKYDDPTKDTGPGARDLIRDIFLVITNSPNYETEYLPLLKQVTYAVEGDGGLFFKALNVWFAGAQSPVWQKGLWQHKSTLFSWHYPVLPVEMVNGDTVHFRTYQISPVTTSPSIGTFCHENGHMICKFPDLYVYSGTGNGVGKFSNMCVSGTTNPVPPDAYLRVAAGWVAPKDLPAIPYTVEITDSLADVWRYVNPADSSQYYLIENRQKTGRNAQLPGSGILVWRCDETGTNRYPESQAAFAGSDAEARLSNELSLEQADGKYELEKGSNLGDANDLWSADNSAASYTGEFSSSSTPVAAWRDGTSAGLRMWAFSSPGDTMTFNATTVPGAEAQEGSVAWATATDGSWYNAASWSGGGIPATNANVSIAVAGDSYTVSVPINTKIDGGSLGITNTQADATATLDVTARLDLSGASPIKIGDGGVLRIGEGGTFLFDNDGRTDITYSGEIMSVAAGGRIEIDGGTLLFTNFNGVANVQGTAAKPAVVSMTSGELVLFPRERTYATRDKGKENISIKSNARFEQTGGVVNLYGNHSGSCPFANQGGEFDISGNSLWQTFTGWTTTDSKGNPNRTKLGSRYVTGNGTTRFRGNAVLDASTPDNDSGIYIHPVANNSTSILEFHDHAKIDAPRSVGIRSTQGSIYIGGGTSNYKGNKSYLRIYSDAEHGSSFNVHPINKRAAAGVIHVGYNWGYGELEVTNGIFGAGGGGFRVGNDGNAKSTYGITGVVHVTGGVLRSHGGYVMSPGWSECYKLCGDLIGCTLTNTASGGLWYGRVEFDGGAYSNAAGNLIIGYGAGKGEWFQRGGTAVVGSDKKYNADPKSGSIVMPTQYGTNNLFAIGVAGGEGSFTQTAGDTLSNMRVFVGGVVTNDMGIYTVYAEKTGIRLDGYAKYGYGDRHNATGYLGVLGGSFTASHAITVGLDGTGVLEIGPTGTVTAAAVVLTNNEYTAEGTAAATLKFSTGEDTAGTLNTTKLVISEGSVMEIDATAFAFNPAVRRLPLIRASNIEGDFSKITVATALGKHNGMKIERVADGWDMSFDRGTLIFLR